MTKLIRYLRPYSAWIALIFLLLFGQAMADLSLPQYMSDIVNIGIQQNGIRNAVPEALRPASLAGVTALMSEADRATVSADYALLDRANLSQDEYAGQVKKYPLLSTSPLYVLKNVNKTERDHLNQIFTRTVTAAAGAGQDVPPTLAKQYAVAFITAEYRAIGVNLGGLRNAYLWRIGLIMLGLALAGTLASVAVGYISARIAAALGRDLRRLQFERVENFSSTEFDKFSTASLITRSTNDITQIQMLMVMLFRFVFYAPIIGIGGIIKVLSLDRSMLWIIAAAVGILLTVVAVMFIIALPKFRSMQSLIDKLNLVTREFISGLMVIRAFNNQNTAERKFDVANTDLTRVSLFINRVIVFMMPVMMLILNGTMLFIIWVGAHQVDASTLQVGDMMASLQYAMLIIFSFLMITFVFIMLPRASVSAVRVSEVLDTKPVIRDPAKPEEFDTNLKGVVEFQDVSFKYPGAEEDVLKHISFTAKSGETTAIIGSTGSGKSTLVNLIMRFYDVSEGRVLVDGKDVRDVSQHDLRDKVGYVPQQAMLFSGTIESNIKYGNEEASQVDLEKVAAIAQATEFINSSERGYATAVAQGGTNFSGGQKQRLSIARALVKKPEIFIFDDSFSALDFRTDAAVRRALKVETGRSTVIIVTQRIGPIMGADQIIVLDNGGIAGIGTHQQLIRDSEVYREIALSQLSREELAA